MNYVEYIICKNAFNITDDPIDINISTPQAEHWIDALHKRGFKPFRKEFKTYIHRDMHMENMGHTDIKVFSQTMTNIQKIPEMPNVAMVEYIKDKQPFHAFPSTTSHDVILYTKRLTFRVHNRIFVNFDVQLYPDDGSTVTKVFINYNHEEGMDRDVIKSTLDTIFPMFKV
jgi:hypothetical protein